MRQELENEYANELEDNFRGYSPKRMIIEILGQKTWDTLVDKYIDKILTPEDIEKVPEVHYDPETEDQECYLAFMQERFMKIM